MSERTDKVGFLTFIEKRISKFYLEIDNEKIKFTTKEKAIKAALLVDNKKIKLLNRVKIFYVLQGVEGELISDEWFNITHELN